MSVLYKENNLFFIDHKEFVTNLYQNVNQTKERFTITGKIFSISKNTDKLCNSKKRRRNSYQILAEVIKVKEMYYEIIKKLPLEIINKLKSYNLLETSDVRELSKKYFETTIFDHKGLSGGNNSDIPLKCNVKNEYFLIPKKSNFLCGCVKEKCNKLIGNKYNIVVADPPWWNKYIRRLKNANEKLGYSMMYNEDIASIPLKELLSDNCIVAVWCTNAPSNILAVKNIIFPAWGVEYITTWYWLKVTVDLEPIYEFGTGSEKQPYERIILGKVGDISLPEDVLIASVPSALHSHKPPLLDLLLPYIKEETPNILELFARYLLPNTTSIGYEPLKWQHISLYEET